jgi:heme A synthase
LILLGLILLVIGVMRLGVREAWGALVGGGLAPLAFLLNDLQNTDILPTSTAQTYQLMAMIFGGIAAVGFVWELTATLRRLRTPGRRDRRLSFCALIAS